MPLTARPSPKRLATMRIGAIDEVVTAAECEDVVGLGEGVRLNVGVDLDVEAELDVGDARVELDPGDEPPVVT